MTDGERQIDEISVMKCIFTEEEFKTDCDCGVNGENSCTCFVRSGVLCASVIVPDGFKGVVRKDPEKDTNKEDIEIELQFLPPIEVKFRLQEYYPSLAPPLYVITCIWLSKELLLKLRQELDRLWEENKGSEILYIWMSFLKEKSLKFVDITKTIDISKLDEEIKKEKVFQLSESQEEDKDLHILLENYNKCRHIQEFQKTDHLCTICYQYSIGMKCIQFIPCKHVFCSQCIADYIQIRINDGAVFKIKCPESKCDSEILPSQVKDLMSPELFERYDSLLLKVTLDTISDIISCPRSDCQYPATEDKGSKLVQCPMCKYSFCAFCKKGYHGIEPCGKRNAKNQKILEEYEKADQKQKTALERKYGKKQLQKILDLTKAENWKNENCKQCPHCKAFIEKSDGCNKMNCRKCDQYFCWLCEAPLNIDQPYSHYNNPNSPCFNLLFNMDDDFLDANIFDFILG